MSPGEKIFKQVQANINNIHLDSSDYSQPSINSNIRFDSANIRVKCEPIETLANFYASVKTGVQNTTVSSNSYQDNPVPTYNSNIHFHSLYTNNVQPDSANIRAKCEREPITIVETLSDFYASLKTGIQNTSELSNRQFTPFHTNSISSNIPFDSADIWEDNGALRASSKYRRLPVLLERDLPHCNAAGVSAPLSSIQLKPEDSGTDNDLPCKSIEMFAEISPELAAELTRVSQA